MQTQAEHVDFTKRSPKETDTARGDRLENSSLQRSYCHHGLNQDNV